MPDVLILDMNYRPVDFCTWQDAIKNIWKDRAIVVKEDESGKVLHSPNFEVGMPRVIRVRNAWVKRRKTSVPFSRRNIYVRDGGECQYCQRHLSTNEYTLDHVIPRSQGGVSSWGNMVLCCVRCNKHKAGRTPEQAGMPLLRKPVVPKVDDPAYNFKLHIRKLRPEWKEWASWLYWNAELEE
jgi:5-methylcytosine-specific restriction endonuclease McrA